MKIGEEEIERAARDIRRARFERTRRSGCFDDTVPPTSNEIEDARAAAIAFGLEVDER